MRACGYSCNLDQGTVEALLGRYDDFLVGMMTCFCCYFLMLLCCYYFLAEYFQGVEYFDMKN